jgi:DNA replication and repair protein RecF
VRLTRLAARGFRNLAPFELSTDAQFVVLYGDNAQGKTNTLETVYYLCTLKPLHGRRTKELVQFDGDQLVVSGTGEDQGIRRTHRVQMDATGRKQWVDDAPIHELTEYFAGLRAVAFAPSDAAIITEEPARRRAWVDRAAFTAHPVHLDVVRTMRRCLKQKSVLLKQPRVDMALLDILDQQLSMAGAELAQRRSALLAELSGHVAQMHERIAGTGASLSLTHRTQAEGTTVRERAGALREQMASRRSQELQRRMALVGPQKDDVVFLLDGQSARSFASRGQVRSLVLALKLAELSAARSRGQVPLFLLDDVSGELDGGRTARLVELLTELGAQVFATTTDRRHLGALPANDSCWFEVASGALSISSKS